MKNFPHEKFGYPAYLVFEGDHVTATPFAWVDAFDGQYTRDFHGQYARSQRATLRLSHMGK